MVPSYYDCQKVALAQHAKTGEAHYLIKLSSSSAFLILPESSAVAAGPSVIDAILWSTATTGDDGLDPALLA